MDRKGGRFWLAMVPHNTPLSRTGHWGGHQSARPPAAKAPLSRTGQAAEGLGVKYKCRVMHELSILGLLSLLNRSYWRIG